MVTGKKKTDESSKEDQVEVPMARGAFAASSDHDAVALGRMMGSFGARTNLIRKQGRSMLFGCNHVKNVARKFSFDLNILIAFICFE